MYAIIEKLELYGPERVRRLVTDAVGTVEVFAEREAANARVREFDAEEYRLSHNESGRPAYTVRRIDRLARDFREQIARAA